MADSLRPNDDILSSIRRLVVDDQRGVSEGKLVLVPHLRIVRSVLRPKPSETLHPLHLHPSSRVEPSLTKADAPPNASGKASSLAEEVPKPAPDPALSEQALRDLVRVLVREQFHGDLGLRITHSIRKMVKAEVAREMDLRNQD